jgi:gamma-D-glutamyl-L-lysine dipeptidyl-peptidase
MKRPYSMLLFAAVAAGMLAGCAHAGKQSAPAPAAAERALQTVRKQYAPDPHLAVFNVTIEAAAKDALVATGEVDAPEAKAAALDALRAAGFSVTDRVRVLPAAELGEAVWGISTLSVANGREQPNHTAELGAQVLMGHPVRILKRAGGWYLAQTAERYLVYIEGGAFVRRTQEQLDAWNRAPRLMVTALEDRILEAPQADAQPVSDVVAGCIVRNAGEHGEWYRVELPDGRAGFLQKVAAMDYEAWRQSRRPSGENIEQTARLLLGRPYLWGGNSPKGVDCSGFTQWTFFMNGMSLLRNASHQATQGTDVPLDANYSRLRKGDLLFFGARASQGRPQRVTHVGIYIGDKLFIHSGGRVRINSLDSSSPLADAHRIRTLLHARRVLPES